MDEAVGRGISIGLLCTVSYAGACKAGFVYDDAIAVAANPVVNGSVPLHQALVRDYWGQRISEVRTYRPLVVILEGIEWRVSRGSPAFLHGTSVALHAFVSVGAYLVFRGLVGEEIALLGAILAALLAATSEVPLTVVGQSDLLVGLFAVLGLAAHRRPGPLTALVSGLLVVLSVASKESGLMVIPAWLLADVVFPVRERRAWGLKLACVSLGFAVVMVLRYRVLGSSPPTASTLGNPLADASISGRILGAGRILLTKYGASLVNPTVWQYECSYAACLPGSPRDPLAWLGVLLAASCLVIPVFVFRSRPLLAFGLGWFALFFAPTSNFIVPSAAAYGGRWLYVPMLGLTLAVAGGLHALGHRLRRGWVAWGLGGALVLANAMALQNRIIDWRTSLDLFRSGLDRAADSAAVQRNLADALARAGEAQEALPHARRALEIVPDYPLGHETLALALDMTGQADAAEAELRWTLNAWGRKATFEQYATFLARHGRLEQASKVAHQGIQQPGDTPQSLHRLMRRLDEDLSPTQ